MTILVCFLSALPTVQGAKPITMTADHWQTKENAEFLRQLRREYDWGGAPGIAFRQQDEGNLELFYLEPDPNCRVEPHQDGRIRQTKLKTTITSDRKQTKKANIVVDGKLLFAEKPN